MTDGIHVRDASGNLFTITSGKSYSFNSSMGGVVVLIYPELDCKGQCLALFVNPNSVMPA